MIEVKTNNYAQNKKLLGDWTGKKNYLFQYSMLKVYVRHSIIKDKNHEIISFKLSKVFEEYINVITQKKNQAVNDFEKDFYKLVNNAYYGKTMDNVRNRIKREFSRKDDNEKKLLSNNQN